MIQLLVQTLEQLNTVHEHLLAVAQQKQKALVERRIEDLSRLVQEESGIVRQIGQLEEERLFQIQQYLRAEGHAPKEEINMEQLIRLVSSPQQQKALRTQTEKLRRTLETLSHQNRLNMRLTEDSLNDVNLTLEWLTTAQGDQPNYDRPETRRQEKRPADPVNGQRFFDAKA